MGRMEGRKSSTRQNAVSHRTSATNKNRVDSITLEVFDPTGSIEVTELHAPRLNSLKGKTICELGNGKWEDHRIFPVLRELLKKRFPDIKIIPYTDFTYGYEIDDDQVAAMVREKGGQGVIVASAS
jgi:hypothetical protein